MCNPKLPNDPSLLLCFAFISVYDLFPSSTYLLLLLNAVITGRKAAICLVVEVEVKCVLPAVLGGL